MQDGPINHRCPRQRKRLHAIEYSMYIVEAQASNSFPEKIGNRTSPLRQVSAQVREAVPYRKVCTYGITCSVLMHPLEGDCRSLRRGLAVVSSEPIHFTAVKCC
jgi:hypothetical protein